MVLSYSYFHIIFYWSINFRYDNISFYTTFQKGTWKNYIDKPNSNYHTLRLWNIIEFYFRAIIISIKTIITTMSI